LPTPFAESSARVTYPACMSDHRSGRVTGYPESTRTKNRLLGQSLGKRENDAEFERLACAAVDLIFGTAYSDVH
jgi:hypothetical protein